MGVAIVAIPMTSARLGAEGFGVVTLAWIVLGYSGVLDLGLSRALTSSLAGGTLRRCGAYTTADLVWTTTVALAIVGGAAAACIWVAVGVLARTGARGGARDAVILVGACLPVVAATAAPRAALESVQRFDVVASLRVVLGSLTYLTPLWTATATGKVSAALLALAVVRALGLVAYGFACRRFVPGMTEGFRIRPKLLRALWGCAGWVTVSSCLAASCVYLDRMVIGWQVSLAAVGTYSAVFEAFGRLQIVPASVAQAVLPAFARARAAECRSLFAGAGKLLLVTMVPLGILVAGLAEPLTGGWLGPSAAVTGGAVGRWLAVGLVLNAVGHIPLMALQGRGHARDAGLVHLLEMPLYGCGLWVFVAGFGVGGAAAIWAGRAAFDTGCLLVLGIRRNPWLSQETLKLAFASAAGVASILLVGTSSTPLSGRVAGAGLAIIVSVSSGMALVRERGSTARLNASGRESLAVWEVRP